MENIVPDFRALGQPRSLNILRKKYLLPKAAMTFLLQIHDKLGIFKNNNGRIPSKVRRQLQLDDNNNRKITIPSIIEVLTKNYSEYFQDGASEISSTRHIGGKPDNLYT